MNIVRVRPTPGGVDQYGDPIAGTESRLTLERSGVAPRSSSDLADEGRSGIIVGLTLFAPYGSDVLIGDRIEVDGVMFDIEGDVGKWHQFMTGWDAGQEIALRRAAG